MVLTMTEKPSMWRVLDFNLNFYKTNISHMFVDKVVGLDNQLIKQMIISIFAGTKEENKSSSLTDSLSFIIVSSTSCSLLS